MTDTNTDERKSCAHRAIQLSNGYPEGSYGRMAFAACAEQIERNQIGTPAPAVTVKPLVWVDEWKNGTRFLADWGTPPISLAGDGTYYWKGGNYPTVENAKAAAQADYERRILSAIETEAPNARADALREAAATCKLLSDGLTHYGPEPYQICEAHILALIDQPAPAPTPPTRLCFVDCGQPVDQCVCRQNTPAPPTVQEAVDVSIQTMRLSGNREEYYVRISCGGRTMAANKYSQGYRNRADYEADTLRHVLLNEPKPRLMDPKYADHDDPRALSDTPDTGEDG